MQNNLNYNENLMPSASVTDFCGTPEYNEFCDQITDMITELLGSDYTVTRGSVRKNNGIDYDSVTLLKEGSFVAPTIYFNELYLCYLSGSSIERIANAVVSDTKNRFSKIDFGDLVNGEGPTFKKVRNRIFFTLINVNRNKELLNDIVWLPYKDLAIVFRFLVFENRGGESGSVLISNTLCSRWGVTAAQLMELASKNTPELFPPKIAKLIDILMEKKRALGETDEKLEEMYTKLNSSIYVITNVQSLLGASVVLYRDTLEKVYELMGTEYYLLPSSIHEFIAVPKGEATRERLELMVRDVNRTEIDPVEVLSDNVYSYPDTDSI